MEVVKSLAKQFTALYEPFSRMYNDPNLFLSPRPSPDCLEYEVRFCTTLEARRNAWVAQLYVFVPEDYHSLIKHSLFDKTVCHIRPFSLWSNIWIYSFAVRQKACAVQWSTGFEKEPLEFLGSIQNFLHQIIDVKLSPSLYVSSDSQLGQRTLQKKHDPQNSHLSYTHCTYDKKVVRATKQKSSSRESCSW